MTGTVGQVCVIMISGMNRVGEWGWDGGNATGQTEVWGKRG